MDVDDLVVERPKLIGAIVLERIRDLIIDRQLMPGERISESGLAQMLKVSKTPVREALLQLRTIGLVTPEDGILRVVRPSLDLVRQAYEVRAGLESLTASLAAIRADDVQLAAIAEAASRPYVHDIAGLRRKNREFHGLVALSSGNALAATQVMNNRDLCKALRDRDSITDHVSIACEEAHVDIAAAMAARDAERARVLMSEHIHYLMAQILDSMQTTA